MPVLTGIQRNILQFVAIYQQREGRSATGTEVQQHFGYTHHSTARQHLQALEKKGFIQLARGGHGVPYHIRLLPPALGMVETLTLPVVGSIAAGSPREAIQQSDRWVEKLEDILPVRPGDFLLTVNGESMIGDGILPGDLVLIHPQETVEAGQIAAVMVHDEEATLKRFYPQPPSGVRLVPSNPTMEDMVFPASEVRVIGRFQGLIRAGHHGRQ